MIRNFFYRAYKTLYAAMEGFIADDCYARASALSFYTLLSIVPVLAVAFGIAKGFGFELILEEQLKDNFYQQPEFAQKMIEFARSTLTHAHGTLIAGVGVVALFWTSFGLLGNLENALNEIWKVGSMRTWMRRIPDYLAVLIFSPIFLVASSSLTIFIVTKIVQITSDIGYYENIRPLIYLGYYLLLFFVSWLFFSFIYYFMTNKSIPVSSSIVAGIIAGSLFQIVQWGYIHFQVYVTSYNAIYGSFAAIPLFLIWLQLSWMITLIGGEVSYHYATTRYLDNPDKEATNEAEIALYLCITSAQNLLQGLLPANLEAIANELQIPLNALQNIAEELVKAKILYKIQSKDDVTYYQTARPLNSICVSDIYQAVIAEEIKSFPATPLPKLLAAKQYFSAFQKAEIHVTPNPCLNEILKGMNVPSDANRQ